MRSGSIWRARTALFAVILGGAALPLHGQDSIPSTQQAIDESPETVGLDPLNDRLSVGVIIDGRGPYHFVVDTGAERTVISRELASRLDLKSGGRIMLHSMSSSGEVATAVIPSLMVSRKPVNDIHAPALAAAHIGAAGMLGTDTLQQQQVLFDFPRKRMTISRSRPASLGRDEIVVTARSLYGRLIVTDADVEGQKVLVVIDTGSDVTIGNEALREKLIAKRKLATGSPIELISVLGDSTAATYTRTKRVNIGSVRLSNMPIAFANVHLFEQLKLEGRPALLLGMDTLQLFDRVAIDFATKKVQFLPPPLTQSAVPTRLAMN